MFESDVATADVIAMNLTIAALEQWLKNVNPDRSGEELGREIGALYREIHTAVDEMGGFPDDDEDEDFDFGEGGHEGDEDDEDDEETD